MFEKFDLIIRNTFSKTLPRAILIGIVCAIAIWIVIDTYFRKPLPPPIAVIPSNITGSSATINYLTKTPLATCATLYSFWPLSFQRSCDLFPSRVHSLRIDGLVGNSTYRLFIESGFHLWVRGSLGFVRDAQERSFPTTHTRSKDYVLDQSKLLTFTGNVIDKDNAAQISALVIMAYSGTNEYWSGTTNNQGNFSLTLPGASLLGDVAINTWSESGYFAETFPSIDLVKEPKKVIVQEYE